MRIFRFLLFPLALLYGLLMLLRNKCYDWGIFKSEQFDVPTISVGNLSMGGTGKTPHVEYLIRLLKSEFNVAVLSRGYKRKTHGFILAGENSTTYHIGDEPLQISNKFRNVQVAVDEKRRNGIKELCKRFKDTDVVLLDDAFQHRAVKPGLSILLTDFHNLYPEDYLFPTGSLREFRNGAKRADIIIVTKTLKVLSPITVRRLTGLIKPLPHQRLFFSYISYGNLNPLPGSNMKPPEEKVNSILLFAGIANMYPLRDHVLKITNHLEEIEFGDHHAYSQKDYAKIRKVFDGIFTKNKIILTTEKDAMRLAIPKIHPLLADLPIFYIPIEVKIHKELRKSFNDQIKNYVRENSGNSSFFKEHDRI
jgi:tetraacyldisaccharide 4'-kinase